MHVRDGKEGWNLKELSLVDDALRLCDVKRGRVTRSCKVRNHLVPECFAIREQMPIEVPCRQ